MEDSAGVLSQGYADLINSLCATLESKTTVEMAVVTIGSLEGLSVEDYAQKLFQRFGIGKKEKNNGILILFARDDRKVRIHVGYGLEAVMTDAAAGHLLDLWAVPRFKERAYGRGLFDLTKAVANRIAETQKVPINLEDPSNTPEEAQPTENVPLTIGNEPEFQWNWTGALIAVGSLASLTLLSLILSILRATLPAAVAAKRKALSALWPFHVLNWTAGGVAAYVYGLMTERFLYPAGLYVGTATLLTLLLLTTKKILRGYIESYQFDCPKCGRPATKLGESADDKYLNQEEIAEELAKGMDYEFWRCDTCDYLHRFDVKLSGASKCPKCGRRSLKSASTTVQAATTSQSGLMRITYDCLNPKCRYHRQESRTIPKISTSSGSSSGSSWGSSGGSSFGGGSSGGGGASRSW